jgi:hypothetical protein
LHAGSIPEDERSRTVPDCLECHICDQAAERSNLLT